MKVHDACHTLLGQGFDSNIHLVQDEGHFLLVDTGTGKNHPRVLGFLNEQGVTRENVVGIVLTHTHPDHSGGVAALHDAFGGEVLVHEEEAALVRDGSIPDLFGMLGGTPTPIDVVELHEGQGIRVGGLRLSVLHTPGHSPGSISLYDEHHRILISGDTVFPGGSFGRTDLDGGNPRSLVESLGRLAELDAMIMLPGHMPPVAREARSQVQASLRNAQAMLL